MRMLGKSLLEVLHVVPPNAFILSDIKKKKFINLESFHLSSMKQRHLKYFRDIYIYLSCIYKDDMPISFYNIYFLFHFFIEKSNTPPENHRRV